MTGFKMDASFRFSSEDVVKPVCEISPLGTFERRCLIDGRLAERATTLVWPPVWHFFLGH
jgi:hypothetical protein